MRDIWPIEWIKFSSKWDAHLAETNFQLRCENEVSPARNVCGCLAATPGGVTVYRQLGGTDGLYDAIVMEGAKRRM